MTGVPRRERRTVKLPKAVDVDNAAVVAFMDACGWDEDVRKRVSSVRINLRARRVEIDVAPRPDVKVTVRNPIVFADDD
jgi:hypothetical protein